MSFLDGMKKILGIKTGPAELFRTSKLVRDSSGQVAIYFFVTDPSKLDKAQKIFAENCVTVSPYKTSMDNFPVLKITWEELEKLPQPANEFVINLHRTLAQEFKEYYFSAYAQVKDREGKVALYFFVKDEKYADPALRFLFLNGVNGYPHRTNLAGHNDELVIKVPAEEIAKMDKKTATFFNDLLSRLKVLNPSQPNIMTRRPAVRCI